jgi:hypothetical protein
MLTSYYLVPTLEYSTTGTRGIEEEDCRSKNTTLIYIVGGLISLGWPLWAPTLGC